MQDRFACTSGDVSVRVATVNDAAAILGIYSYYVENLAVTFECEVPSVDEIAARIERTLSRYPYFVAELLPAEGETVAADVTGNAESAAPRIVGFAYAGPLRMRSAYDRAVETSIYVASDTRGKGTGRALYRALEDALGKMGVIDMYACVACADAYDEHLSDASLRFHERQGFSKVGLFENCGYKFGRWYSIAWMTKALGEHIPDPPAVRMFSEACI